jgi:hypothetical protein
MKKKTRVFKMRVTKETQGLIERIRERECLKSLSETVRWLVRNAEKENLEERIVDELAQMLVGEAGIDFGSRQNLTKDYIFNVKLFNAVENYPHILQEFRGSAVDDVVRNWDKDFQHLEEDGRPVEGFTPPAPQPVLQTFENAFPKQPAIVLGSGVSLDKALPLLREWDGLLFAGASQAGVLRHEGIKPDFLLSYDPWRCQKELVGPHANDYEGWNLITHPCIDPFLVKNWNGNRFYFWPMVQHFEWQLDNENLTFEQYINKYQVNMEAPVERHFRDNFINFHADTLRRLYGDWNPWMAGGIRPALFMLGCTPNMATAIAFWMGCEPIILVGCDYAFLNGKGSALRYQWDDGAGWETMRSAIPDTFRVAERDIPTTTEMINYKVALMTFLIMHDQTGRPPQVMLSASDGEFGILGDILECLPLEDVIAAQGKGFKDLYLTHEEWITVCNKYMESKGNPPIWFKP